MAVGAWIYGVIIVTVLYGELVTVAVAVLVLVAAGVLAGASFIRFGPRGGWQALRRIGAKSIRLKSPRVTDVVGVVGWVWGILLGIAAAERLAWILWGTH